MSLTDTYGFVSKKSLVKVNNSILPIEDIWDQYKSEVTTNTIICEEGMEETVPATELSVTTYDEEIKKFKQVKITKLFRHKMYNCTSEIHLENGLSITFTEKTKFLTPDGWKTKCYVNSLIGMPKNFDDYVTKQLNGSYTCITDGDMYFIKVNMVGIEILNDYVYGIEVNNPINNSIIVDGIICNTFDVSSK